MLAVAILRRRFANEPSLLGRRSRSGRDPNEMRMMLSATRTLGIVWRALDLELPRSRRPHGARFFVGFKPLLASARASLLRAMARTLIEAGYVPVRKDARRDPVELIASALEIGIERWDRTSGASGALGDSPAKLRAACIDVAVQVAAFDLLLETTIGVDRAARWRAALVALADAVVLCAGPDAVLELARTFGHVRTRARGVLGSINSAHRDAVLVEIIVLGSASLATQLLFAVVERDLLGRGAHLRLQFCCAPVERQQTAFRFADGLILVARGHFAEALVAFEAILDRVPGHALALEQAARCCFMLGDPVAAQLYAKRASRGGPTTRRAALQRDERGVGCAELRRERHVS